MVSNIGEVKNRCICTGETDVKPNSEVIEVLNGAMNQKREEFAFTYEKCRKTGKKGLKLAIFRMLFFTKSGIIRIKVIFSNMFVPRYL